MLVIVGSPICWWHRTCLVVQDHAEEATLNRQPAVAAVIDKAKLSELVHKMTDLRPGEASELSQLCLINFGNCSFGSSFLVKMSEQQEYTGQTLLAGVEKLVDQTRFVSDVARKQMGDEHF